MSDLKEKLTKSMRDMCIDDCNEYDSDRMYINDAIEIAMDTFKELKAENDALRQQLADSGNKMTEQIQQLIQAKPKE